MNSKQRKLKIAINIIIVIIFIMIIAFVAFLFKVNNKTKNMQENTKDESIGSSILDDYKKNVNDTISNNAYLDINNCMIQYLNTININSETYYTYDNEGNRKSLFTEHQIKEEIYNLLGNEFIEENKITIDNLFEHVKPSKEKLTYVPLEAKIIQDEQLRSFLISGILVNSDYKYIENIFAVINLDVANNLFSINPINGNYNSIDEINIEILEKNINRNRNNRYVKASVDNESICNQYINLYKSLVLSKPDIMYNKLDDKYKSNRFNNLDEFEEYIEENKERILQTRLKKFRRRVFPDYTQYICIDQNDNIYIFEEKSPLDYKVMMDAYTIDLPEIVEKYNNSTDEEKVLMNIQKIIQAINNCDYKYVYNKLDSTFRESNFKSIEEFEKYMKNNFFKQNKASAGNPRKQGDIYIYDVVLEDAIKPDNEKITKNFIMQLKDGTDYIMSFSI